MTVDLHTAKPGEMKFVPCHTKPGTANSRVFKGYQKMGKQRVLDNSCGEDNRIKRAGVVQDIERKWPL